MARGAGDVGGHRGSRIRRFQWSSEGENTIGVGSRQNGGENFKKKQKQHSLREWKAINGIVAGKGEQS